MKLYHGSPRKLKRLVPKQAKGIGKFENKKAIFLCKTLKHAALYSIGKNLKGKTTFAPTPNKLIIVRNLKPKSGYVFEVDVKANKGPRGQFSYNKQIRKFKVYKISPKDYEKNIIYVKNKKELIKRLK